MEPKLLPGEHVIMPFQDQAFNADTFMCKKFIELKKKFDITTVIELGSAVGGTTRWFCENFDKVITIEIEEQYRNVCLQRIAGYKNVESLLGSTLDVLPGVLDELTGNIIFFIDSHWGGDNPLPEELEIINKSGFRPVLAIHDFKVPGNPDLGFDKYGDIVYQWDWIQANIERIYGKNGYTIEYNSRAEGAKRGVIYILPV